MTLKSVVKIVANVVLLFQYLIFFFSVPKGQFVPGSKILGRWLKTKKYYEGFVSKIDSRIHLQFDDGDKTSHDVNDIAAVLFDRIPEPAELKVRTPA